MTRALVFPRRAGAFFDVPLGGAVDLISLSSMPARLGATGTGDDVSAPWLSPGYRTCIVGDGWTSALLVLRAAGSGSRVLVISDSPQVWLELVRRCGIGSLVVVRDEAETARPLLPQPQLVVVDTPGTSTMDIPTVQVGSALVVVRRGADVSDVDFLRACHLVFIAPSALPAGLSSVAGALVGPQFAGRSLEPTGVLVRADNAVLEMRLAISDAEAQALGLRV